MAGHTESAYTQSGSMLKIRAPGTRYTVLVLVTIGLEGKKKGENTKRIFR